MPSTDAPTTERLQKVLAAAGVGSRRACEDLIFRRRVTVNGRVAQLGDKVDPATAEIHVDGERVVTDTRLVYLAMNKPRGVVSTMADEKGRAAIADFLGALEQRVYHVGRLDADSEGLLLLTNDGDLAFRMLHPRFGVEKTYLVQVAGNPTWEDIQQLMKGVYLSEGHVKARSVKRLRKQGESSWLRIVLAEGKNREIRRMLARLGHKVLRLKRIAIGPIELGHLRTGKSRPLTPDELKRLKRLAARVDRQARQDEEVVEES